VPRKCAAVRAEPGHRPPSCSGCVQSPAPEIAGPAENIPDAPIALRLHMKASRRSGASVTVTAWKALTGGQLILGIVLDLCLCFQSLRAVALHGRHCRAGSC
jgi:hypothetical protein